MALLIAAVIAAGLVAKVRADGFDALRREAALPIAMLVASPALFTLVALGRGRAILDTIIQSQRFVYVGAALTLPAIAVAVQALASVRRELALLIALPLFGVPGNVAEFNSNFFFNRDNFASEKDVILSLASAPLHDAGNPNPFPQKSPPYPESLTLPWLLRMHDQGRIPDREPLASEVERAVPVMLGISQGHQPRPAALVCGDEQGPLSLTTVEGEHLALVEPVRITNASSAGRTLSVVYRPIYGELLEFRSDGLELRIEPESGRDRWRICRA